MADRFILEPDPRVCPIPVSPLAKGIKENSGNEDCSLRLFEAGKRDPGNQVDKTIVIGKITRSLISCVVVLREAVSCMVYDVSLHFVAFRFYKRN